MTKVNTIYEKNMQRHLIRKGAMEYYFLPGGGICDIRQGQQQINLFSGNIFDYSPTNIYLRIYDIKNNISLVPLMGPVAQSEVLISSEMIEIKGIFQDVSYKVSFAASEKQEWFWHVELANHSKRSIVCDLVYFQDIAIAPRDAARRNEAYVSHYLDHQCFELEKASYVLVSRQNEAVSGKHSAIISACLQGGRSFLMDGAEFFGASSRKGEAPAALSNESFSNHVYQGEFACHCLASDKHTLEADDIKSVTFYAAYACDSTPFSEDCIEIPDAFELSEIQNASEYNKLENLFACSKNFRSKDLSSQELDNIFPGEKLHLETDKDNILSFFTKDKRHVVTMAKELRVERPHGHMLRGSKAIFPEDNIASSTVWMNGVFASHVSFGNTSFGQYISNQRGTWNFSKSGGLRIFINRNNGWELLGLPSVFEMGFNSAKWIFSDEISTIQVCSEFDSQMRAIVKMNVLKGPAIEVLCSIKLAMGGDEFAMEFPVEISNDGFTIKAPENSTLSEVFPEALMKIYADGEVEYSLDDKIYADNIQRNNPVLTISGKELNELILNIADNYPQNSEESISEKELFNGRGINGDSSGIKALSSIFPWYVHNAMIHFATPAGLEQYCGAAWGTRDICQGPVELLSTLGHPSDIRQILITVFSHQYENGDWPQWFMFDGYSNIQQHESHGDVRLWPLKAVCEYIENYNDFSILEEKVVFTGKDCRYTNEQLSIFEHIEIMLKNVTNSFIPGTSLISYGGGDWNDSLQPINEDTASKLVSSWTVQLLYQNLLRFAEVCRKAGKEYEFFEKLAQEIKIDFNKYLVKDGITAGFGLFDDEGKVIKLLLHPEDDLTGINYRLLPVNRGILSSIFTPEQAEKHLKTAKENLVMPDGAHLMDKPPVYNRGKSRIFKRAETAAFFGREIGTNYIHAHLRYAEALAKCGKAEELYQALLQANPVEITNNVPNALPRQSNTYFSSSDADVSCRKQASDDFELLRTGEMKVKGGWRIYSSGPGIFVNLLFSFFCGIRRKFDKLIIDPVIPKSAGNFVMQTRLDNKKCRFEFYPDGISCSVKSIIVNGKKIDSISYEDNPYRQGGAEFDYHNFVSNLCADSDNVIQVNI